MTPQVHKTLRSLRSYAPDYVNTDRLSEVLEKLGLDVLGAGMYGVVADCGDFVLKILTTDDHAYLDFLDFCEQVESPYLPTILWDKKINEALWAVCLEKLDPVVENSENWDDDKVPNEDFQLIRRYLRATYRGSFKPYIENRDLKALLDLMHEVRSNEGHYSDLHCGNVMLRGEQLVISDPWC